MSSNFLPDKNKLSLTKDDLFDKIINLKLIVKRPVKGVSLGQEADAFIIRSDYEAVFPKQEITNVFRTGQFISNQYYIRKCAYKPSIKVQYKRLAKDTLVSLDIFVSNFIIFTSKGEAMATFNKTDYDLVGVELMLGYWGQFKNMPHNTLNDLFKFEPMFGADKITLTEVEYVTTDKLAPDFTLHIHGYVGSTLTAPVDTQSVKTFDEITSSGLLETFGTPDPKQSDLSKIFYNHITRRFLRNPVNPKDNQGLQATDMIETIPTDKILSKFNADNYGVLVYTSDGVDKIHIKKLKDSEENEVDVKVYLDEGDTLDNAMTRLIQKLVPEGLDYKKLNTGNIILFTKEEAQDIPSLMKQFQKYNKDSVFNKVYKNELPAIYNININETALITCPFFSFIEPFQEVKFKSRYTLSSKVSYYVNSKKDRNSFTATSVTVTFSTTEDDNIMEIYCISNPPASL